MRAEYPPVQRTHNLNNHTVGDEFPEVFHLEILDRMRLFNAVHLAMAAVAGDHQHPGAGGPNLIDFSAAIKDSLLVVSIYQRAAAAATADLVHFRRIKIGPVIHTLAEDPARFFEKSMPKPFLGSAPIVARIMIGRRSLEPCFIQLDAPLFNIPYEQIEYRNKFELFKHFGMVFFETRPGRQISVPSFGPHQCFDLQRLHMFDNATAHDFHGLVITGKIGPVGSFPVFRRNRPVLFGPVKNPPPMF